VGGIGEKELDNDGFDVTSNADIECIFYKNLLGLCPLDVVKDLCSLTPPDKARQNHVYLSGSIIALIKYKVNSFVSSSFLFLKR
jgi:hypothetical protein